MIDAKQVSKMTLSLPPRLKSGTSTTKSSSNFPHGASLGASSGSIHTYLKIRLQLDNLGEIVGIGGLAKSSVSPSTSLKTSETSDDASLSSEIDAYEEAVEKSLDLDVISEFRLYCITIAFQNSPVLTANSGVFDFGIVGIVVLEE